MLRRYATPRILYHRVSQRYANDCSASMRDSARLLPNRLQRRYLENVSLAVDGMTCVLSSPLQTQRDTLSVQYPPVSFLFVTTVSLSSGTPHLRRPKLKPESSPRLGDDDANPQANSPNSCYPLSRPSARSPQAATTSSGHHRRTCSSQCRCMGGCWHCTSD